MKHPAQPAPGTRAAAFRRLAQWYAIRSGEADCERDLKAAMEGELNVVPKLKAVAGGLPRVLAALRAYDDEDASAFLAVYDSRSAFDRRLLTWEEIAVAADIGATRLYGVASEAMLAYEEDARKMMLATGVTKITRKSIQMALTDKGIDDRLAMLKAGGVIPVPKGSQIAIQVNQRTEALSAVPDATPTTWDQEAQIRKLHEAWGERAKALPPAGEHELPQSVVDIQNKAAEVLDDVF